MMRDGFVSRRIDAVRVSAAVTLPWLESLGALWRRTATPPRRMASFTCQRGHSARLDAQSRRDRLRLADDPRADGPLQDFAVISGLTCDSARPNGDARWRSCPRVGGVLIGAQARKTAGPTCRRAFRSIRLVARLATIHAVLAGSAIGRFRGVGTAHGYRASSTRYRGGRRLRPCRRKSILACLRTPLPATVIPIG